MLHDAYLAPLGALLASGFCGDHTRQAFDAGPLSRTCLAKAVTPPPACMALGGGFGCGWQPAFSLALPPRGGATPGATARCTSPGPPPPGGYPLAAPVGAPPGGPLLLAHVVYTTQPPWPVRLIWSVCASARGCSAHSASACTGLCALPCVTLSLCARWAGAQGASAGVAHWTGGRGVLCSLPWRIVWLWSVWLVMRCARCLLLLSGRARVASLPVPATQSTWRG